MTDAPGINTRVTGPHREGFAALEPEQDLLLNGGRTRLRVINCGTDFADTKVMTGGELSDRKGLNVPGAVLPLAALTAKDRKDLHLALEPGVDWIGLSFIQRAEDVIELKRLVKGRAGIIAKLEKPARSEEHKTEI